MAARSSSSPSIPSACTNRRKILGFKIPYSVAEIDEACRERPAQQQGFADAYVRPIAWRGSEQMGVVGAADHINVAIAVWEWPSYFDPAQRAEGHPPRHRPNTAAPTRAPRRQEPRRPAST